MRLRYRPLLGRGRTRPLSRLRRAAGTGLSRPSPEERRPCVDAVRSHPRRPRRLAVVLLGLHRVQPDGQRGPQQHLARVRSAGAHAVAGHAHREPLTTRAARAEGAHRGQGRRTGRRTRRTGQLRGDRRPRPGVPPGGRRRPDRLHRPGTRQHAALGTGRHAGHRSDEPAHDGELPDRRRALRLVLPGPCHRSGRGVRGPRHLRRRSTRRHRTRLGRRHHPPVPRCGSRHHGGGHRQHHRPLRLAPRPARPDPQGPSLVPAAFNEVLRFWAPVHAWGRRATEDVEIDGTLIPAGAQVAVLFGAATATPGTSRTRTPSWSSAIPSTTSRSATARTAARARGSPGWRPMR